MGPRLRYLAQALGLCIFPVASLVIGILALVYLPQGQEILRTISAAVLLAPFPDPDDIPRVVLFFVALSLWLLSSWFSARIVLQRDFDAGPGIAARAPKPYEIPFRTWFPRSLILIGSGFIAYRLATFGEAGATLVAIILGVALFSLVWQRRRLLRRWAAPAAASSVAATTAGALRADLPESEELALWLGAPLAGVLLLFLWLDNYELARFLGGASILLLALSSISIVGSIVLIYIPKIHGWPAMTGAALVFAFVLGSIGATDNHGIAARRVDAEAQTLITRPGALKQFGAWESNLRPDPNCPRCGPNGWIVLVAAEGGASRSAWWTAHVLGVLDDLTEARFGRQTFVASGISGGSLGVATWVSLLRDRRDAANATSLPRSASYPTAEECDPALVRRDPSLARQSACFLGGDFVATTLGYMAGVDLAQRLIPFPVSAWDRSRGLEVTWARDWRAMFGSDAFARPLLDLYKPAAASTTASSAEAPTRGFRADIPVLLLNTSSVDRGRPAVQAPVQFNDAEIDDLFDSGLRTAGLTLAGAVHNSARFPYVSPGGDVLTSDGSHYDAVVDGGYIENSGALALDALLRSMWHGSLPEDIQKRLIVLFIANDPDEPIRQAAQICTPSRQDHDLQPTRAWDEVQTPLIGLYEARASRADTARRALLRDLRLCDAATHPALRAFFVSMASPMIREVRPAMSWYMTPHSRETMWRAVATSPARAEILALADLFGPGGDKQEAYEEAVVRRLDAYAR